MFKILQKTLRAGTVTQPYPETAAKLAAGFRGLPEFDLENWRDRWGQANQNKPRGKCRNSGGRRFRLPTGHPKICHSYAGVTASAARRASAMVWRMNSNASRALASTKSIPTVRPPTTGRV